MVKSRTLSCVALMVSAALLLPRSSVTADGQARAAGGPYTGDCPAALANAANFEKGLKSLDEPIKRTERQLENRDANRKMSREAAEREAEARQALAKETTLSVLANVAEVKRALQRLMLTAAGKQVTQLVKATADLEQIEKLYEAAKFAMAVGKWNEVVKQGHTGVQRVAELARFLDDAGLTGKLGAMAAVSPGLGGAALGGAAVSGIVGSLVVAVGVYAIDTVAADQENFQNTLDEKQAADTLNALKDTRSMYQDRIAAVRSRCAPQTQRAQQSNAKAPTSPRPIPPPEAARGGPSVGKAIAVAGVATAATVAAIVYVPQLVNSASGPDCSAQKTAMDSALSSLMNAVNNLSLCGANISCLTSGYGALTSATSAIANTGGNYCGCLGVGSKASAAERADFQATAAAANVSPGNFPSCMK